MCEDMRGSSSGGSSVDLKVVSLQDLFGHSDSHVSQLAQEAARHVPDTLAFNPIQEVLDGLVEERSQVPDQDPKLSALDSAIIPLTTLVRKMFAGGPYDISRDSAPPPPSALSSDAVAASQMLMDLNEQNLLHEASDLLGVKYLSDADGPVAWPVQGILYGTCQRPLVCLPTAVGSRSYKHIIYLVDTGAPGTELSPHAFAALGHLESVPNAAFVQINGNRQQVFLCAPKGNHPDIPVLGADSMKAMGLTLTINYKTAEVTLGV